MLVLVGDAESEYAEIIRELLRRQSHRIVLAASSDSCRRFLDRSRTDLIILSNSITQQPLPDLIAEFAERQSAPIVALIDSTSPEELTACFNAGADDCIRKPFHASEFVARIDALSRRMHRPTEAASEEYDDDPAAHLSVVESGPHGLTFDHAREQVFYRGQDLNCTQLEYQILAALTATDGEVVSHSFLNERIWGYSNLADGTLLKGHVSSIRRKFAAVGLEPDTIRTIYGVGYAMSA